MRLQLIAGLQNPSEQYERTRHNAGRWFLDAILAKEHLSLKKEKKFQGELASIAKDDNNCYLFAPTCFMNLSGLAVKQVMDYYKISPNSILIAHDDLDLPAGTIKLKKGGGHGGHNGLRDIISHLGTTEFHRLRIGIGHPGNKDKVHDYVLSAPSKNDKELINAAIMQALNVLPNILALQWSHAMQTLHTT
ncbi:MAG: aminoacyl-tRNA hydrolase [Legionellales bacterium RIFCSPHIGHO2_12_FULL_37_14]|nr:MAG: aminoacyl-tRNA hydrolase [Legionellales bacterium RIFCSPHIGHO2_12_FULL_37_14]